MFVRMIGWIFRAIISIIASAMIVWILAFGFWIVLPYWQNPGEDLLVQTYVPLTFGLAALWILVSGFIGYMITEAKVFRYKIRGVGRYFLFAVIFTVTGIFTWGVGFPFTAFDLQPSWSGFVYPQIVDTSLTAIELLKGVMT